MKKSSSITALFLVKLTPVGEGEDLFDMRKIVREKATGIIKERKI